MIVLSPLSPGSTHEKMPLANQRIAAEMTSNVTLEKAIIKTQSDEGASPKKGTINYDESKEDLDRIQMENSAFKYMFKNFLNNSVDLNTHKTSKEGLGQSRSASKGRRSQPNCSSASPSSSVRKRNMQSKTKSQTKDTTEWKLVRIQEIRVDSATDFHNQYVPQGNGAGNLHQGRFNSGHSIEDNRKRVDSILSIRNLSNNTPALNITSPHVMKYKREKGLKTLCASIRNTQKQEYDDRTLFQLRDIGISSKRGNIRQILKLNKDLPIKPTTQKIEHENAATSVHQNMDNDKKSNLDVDLDFLRIKDDNGDENQTANREVVYTVNTQQENEYNS